MQDLTFKPVLPGADERVTEAICQGENPTTIIGYLAPAVTDADRWAVRPVSNGSWTESWATREEAADWMLSYWKPRG